MGKKKKSGYIKPEVKDINTEKYVKLGQELIKDREGFFASRYFDIAMLTDDIDTKLRALELLRKVF